MRGQRKSYKRRFFLRGLAASSSLLCLYPHRAFSQDVPTSYHAAQTMLNTLAPPAANALPVIKQTVTGVGGIETNAAGNQLIVHQDEKNAIIDWSSFDIGANAETIFDQQGHVNWAALNRIYDQNPSQIYGKLAADGKVFLLNGNGILFGPGSTTNVHSLVATSLNLSNDDFLNNKLHFIADPADPATPGDVSNQGTIVTDLSGAIFLIAPTVENRGAITSPSGQIGLAAGTDVTITPVTLAQASNRIASWVNVNAGAGTATNRAGGQLQSDTGLVGMYGRMVNQEGMIRTVVAFEGQNKTGIELLASDKVTTGAASVTEAPISTSSQTQILRDAFAGGKIAIGGLAAIPGGTGVPTVSIEHLGRIIAPAGDVTMNASARILLDAGSSIDVSGSWVERSIADAFVDVKLTSEVLRDDQLQKGGVLQGATVRVNAVQGTAIGDISGALAARENTALESSTKAGFITLNATGGDVVVNPGASLAFAGGGTAYASGMVATTKLVSGNTLYDIGQASPNLVYDGVFGHYEKQNTRYNVTDSYSGLGYGNGTVQYFQGFVQGSDGGQLTIWGNALALNGKLDGHATAGIYQTAASEKVNTFEQAVTSGLRRPLGGVMKINSAATDYFDVVKVATGTGSGHRYAMGDPLPTVSYNGLSQALTILPAEMISAAGLSSLIIGSDTSLEIDEDAKLSLEAGGELIATARQVVNRGAITIHGGTVNLYCDETFTSYPEDHPTYIPMQERILLTGTSSIDVSGERVDNRLAGMGGANQLQAAMVNGGKVFILDQINSVRGGGELVIEKGATVDVSGGYELSFRGALRGGNAGTIDLQGSALVNEGSLVGRALAGFDGGTVTLHADEVLVGTKVPLLPTNYDGSELLPVDFFAGYLPNDLIGGISGNQLPATKASGMVFDPASLHMSGFTHITVKSSGDLLVQSGIELSPSVARNISPLAAGLVDGPQASQVMSLADDLLGTTSLSLTAGKGREEANNLYPTTLDYSFATLKIAENAALRVTPAAKGTKSSISLLAPTVEIAGQILAPAGNVSMTAGTTNGLPPSITIKDTATISTAGVNILNPSQGANKAPATYHALEAGTIALTTSDQGSVTVAQGALLDVSGSAPVIGGYYPDITDSRVLAPIFTAGKGGGLALSFGQALSLQGTVRAGASMAGVDGGTLSINRVKTDAALTLSDSDIGSYLASGFDSLSFASVKGLEFVGPIDRMVVRNLVLDAPVISSSNGADITLAANAVQIKNSMQTTSAQGATSTAGNLDISGNWLDVIGGSLFSGFDNVALHSANDLTFKDTYSTGTVPWVRTLAASNNLTLQAARIYPKTGTDFTVDAGGTITVLGTATKATGPIYSAGGNLAFKGHDLDFENNAYLAAPMGQLSLEAAADGGRVYQAAGTTLSTKGEANVAYGLFGESSWTVASTTGDPTDANQNVVVSAAPGKAVSLSGAEVIVRQGANIDVSGGGAITGVLFLPDLQGSVNPLAGKYVILPDNSVKQSGQAVYLNGSEKLGLQAGVYSLLPAEFAFVPGAVVVQALGTTVLPGQRGETANQGSIVAGYTTQMGITAAAPLQTAFLLRSAAHVLREGNFVKGSHVAGDGGTVTLQANSAILDGSIAAIALQGFAGGVLDLQLKKEIEVGSGTSPLPDNFSFATALPAELTGKLALDGGALSDAGLSALQLGAIARDEKHQIIADQTTDAIILREGSLLNIPTLTLAAEQITLGAGATLAADSGAGSMTLSADRVEVAEGAGLHAAKALSLEADTFDMRGSLMVDDGGSLALLSSYMYFLPAGISYQDVVNSGGQATGMYLPTLLRQAMTGLQSVTLQGREGMQFLSDAGLDVAGALTLDTALLTVNDAYQVDLHGATVNMMNSGGALATGGNNPGSPGALTVSADQLNIGNGDLLVDGFGKVSLASNNDLVFRGKGSLTVNGDLALSAGQVTTSYFQQGNEPFQPADFVVHAVDSALSVLPVAPPAGATTVTEAPGGSLELTGRSVDISGTVDVPAGNLSVIATGKVADGDGIFLQNTAVLAARGNIYENKIQAGGQEQVLTTVAPGGSISLNAADGSINLAAGSQIDVSTVKGDGDAGTISLNAPTGGVALGGELLADAGGGGGGGVLKLQTNSIANFTSFYTGMAQSGFSRGLSLGVRTGDIVVGPSLLVTTPNLSLASDGGDIRIEGTIDASTTGDGGSVKLYGKNVVVDGGTVLANGQNGGTVEMGAAVGSAIADGDGWITLENGARLDVSGSNGTGGKVAMRAGINSGNDDLKMSLDGAITGAASTVAEAVNVYTLPGNTLTEATLNNLGTATQNFIDAQQGDVGKGKSRLLTELQMAGADANNFHLRPGIEVRNATGTDLNVTSTFNLSDANQWRYDGEPGVLTLRSATNLVVSGSIIDAPTAAPAGQNPSWAINLVAGADLASGNVLATQDGNGNLSVGKNATGSVVFSDSGAVRFASGGDTSILKGVTSTGYFYFANSGVSSTLEKLDYTLASVAGDIVGQVGGDLSFTGGAIQDGTGAISLAVTGNLQLYDGAIRTIGKPPELPADLPSNLRNLPAATLERYRLQQYWAYTDGGDITVDVGKSYDSQINKAAWGTAYLPSDAGKIIDLRTGKLATAWSANYGGANFGAPLRGLAAMGGGNVDLRVGADCNGQVGTFGAGNLSLRAGGDINGRFLVAHGAGNILGMANLGSSSNFGSLLELLDASVVINAQGDLRLGAIVNPTLVNEAMLQKNPEKYWNLTYGHTRIDPATGEPTSSDSAVRLTSVFGDVTLQGQYDYFQNPGNLQTPLKQAFAHLLPPVLEVRAGHDIMVQGNYTMAPSPTGQLSMVAGHNIEGTTAAAQEQDGITMADMDPATVYGDHGDEISASLTAETILGRMNQHGGIVSQTATVIPLHSGDLEPVAIMAGADISAIAFTLAKQARIKADGDIYQVNYIGQNVSASDTSEIVAGGDISLQRTAAKDFAMGITQGGPGFMLVKAGGNLGLGDSNSGITTLGNASNLSLGADGSTLGIMVGYDKELSAAELHQFFTGLRRKGADYSNLVQDDKPDEAAAVLASAREEIIVPILGVPTLAMGDPVPTGGNLDMTSSRITTTGGANDIFMVVRGDINVGRTALSSTSKNTGITTARGGGINVFSSYGDLNVNESRLMTFMGGDITAWCDGKPDGSTPPRGGNINAGRGSTTAISAEGESYTQDTNGNLMPVFSPPSVGSGIRTLTFDPDGSAGPLTAPVAGNVALFAPEGEIDAGEAGIAGTNVILAATKVVNAQNISFSQGGVGLPAGGDAAAGLGALSGGSGLANIGKDLADESSSLARAQQQFADQAALMAEAFKLKWLTVDFIGFGPEEM